jgi:hypothetical protein
LVIAALCFAAIGLTTRASTREPWRLAEALDAPDRLTIEGSYRARYEKLHNSFRAFPTAFDRILVQRLLFHVRADFGRFYLGGELQDSRAQLDDAGPPLGNDDVNAAELLRAYVGYRRGGVFKDGDSLDLRAGRITIGAGSRRLVARNRFRNTINAFTGIHADWTAPRGSRVRAFFTLPVHRRPWDWDRLERNSIVLDDESTKMRFWGILASRKRLFGGVKGELYVFGLNEDDRSDVPTRNRDLYTPGFRLFTKPAAGAWDFEVEGMVQTGTSRATPLPGDVTDLDHRAGFVHAHVARTLERAWSPRIVLQYDYASGDRSPDDGDIERFATLYGARRFELGPTGIYGALTRRNLSSPGLRVEVNPSDRVDGMFGYRAVFLASSRDFWIPAAVRDPTGASGRSVGQQVEARLRYAVLPGNLRLEAGGAVLFEGSFLRNAPTAPGEGDTTYFYTQATLTF